MKKAAAAKKLLLSTERVRDLRPDQLATTKGGMMCAGCSASYQQAPPPPPGGCTVGGFTTIRCISSMPC